MRPKKGIIYIADSVGSRGPKNSEAKTMTSTLFTLPRQIMEESRFLTEVHASKKIVV
jgi:hypothetical protein